MANIGNIGRVKQPRSNKKRNVVELPNDGLEESYITFSVADKGFGIEARKIYGVCKNRKISLLSGKPKFINGLVKVGGNIIPIVDFMSKLGIAPGRQIERECIIIFSCRDAKFGIMVDELPAPQYIVREDIKIGSSVRVSFNSDCLIGIGKCEDATVFLLDFDKMLSTQDIEECQLAVAEARRDTADETVCLA